MRKFRNNLYINILPECYIVAALLLMIIPLKWILAWILATIVHELFHYFVLYLHNVSVLSITLGARGIIMKTEAMSYKTELLSALAGPIGALTLLTFAKWLPLTAICAFCQSAYNLLPIFPLDGGRALRCIAKLLLESQLASRICTIFEGCVTIIIFLFGLYCCTHLHLGVIPLIGGTLLLFKTCRIKIPCKDSKHAVQ